MTALDNPPEVFVSAIQRQLGSLAARHARLVSTTSVARLVLEELTPSGERCFTRTVTFADVGDAAPALSDALEKVWLTEDVLDDDDASWSRLPSSLRAQALATVQEWTAADGGTRPQIRLRLAEDVLAHVRMGRLLGEAWVATKNDRVVDSRQLVDLRAVTAMLGMGTFWFYDVVVRAAFERNHGAPNMGFALAVFLTLVVATGVVGQLASKQPRRPRARRRSPFRELR